MENKKEFTGVIKINGIIDDKMYNEVAEQIDLAKECFYNYKYNTSMMKREYIDDFPEILFEISSPGGYTSVGCSILDKMQELKDLNITLHAHAVGQVASMAFILYCFCQKRSSGKFARFMQHGSSGMHGGYLVEAKSSVENEEEVEAMFEEIILENTKYPLERIEKARNRADFFGYKTAKELEVINWDENDKEVQIEEFSKKLTKGYERAIDVFSNYIDVDYQTGEEILHDLILDQPLEEDDDDDYESPEFLDCFEISEDCQDCPDKKECFDVKLESMRCCIESGKCDTCDGKEECLEDRRTMLSIVCDDNTCESCDYVDLCDTVEFDIVKDKDKSECQAPHCSGDCCNCDLCDIEVEEDIEPEEHECDCDGSCDNCTCDKDNIPEILELDNVPNCYGEVSPHDEECLSCNFLNACCVKTKAELESCKEITKQEEGIDCYKCEFKEECKEQLEFCDKVLNITNN